MLTTSLSLGVALMFVAAAAYLAPFMRTIPHTVMPIRTPLMDPTLWAPRWPHDAPDEPLTVAEAHRTMQRHRNCLREECPRKNAAYRVLVEAGDIRPDASRTS